MYLEMKKSFIADWEYGQLFQYSSFHIDWIAQAS